MKKTTLILIFLFFFIVPTLASSYLFEQGKEADIKVSCFDINDNPCPSSTSCNLTIIHPNSSVVVDNGVMSKQTSYYNYTLNGTKTTSVGEYSAISNCNGSTSSFTTFTFEITPNGEKPTTASGILYTSLFVFIVFLFGLTMTGIFKIENLYGKFAMVQLSYFLWITVLFISWNLASNFLTSTPYLISFIFTLFRIFFRMYFVFLICSVLWLVFELRKIKVVESLIERGVPHDEALARSVRKGKAKW